MLERLGNIALQLLIVLIIVAGLWIFKGLVLGSFETTASLAFILMAFFLAGLACTLLAMFAPDSVRSPLIKATLVILGMFTAWSIMFSTSQVAAGANQDTATGWYSKVSSFLRPADAYNAEAKLQAERKCDEAIAKKRREADDKLVASFEQSTDNDVEAFLKERKALHDKYDAAVLCKTDRVNFTLPVAPATTVSEPLQPAPSQPIAQYGLEFGKAYKYKNCPKVYVYDSDGKLHWLSSEAAFIRYYNCTRAPGAHINTCQAIYSMPVGVPKSMFGKQID